MKRLIAFLLLIAFGVLLTPRDLLHNCDHDHSTHIAKTEAHDHDHQDGNHHDDAGVSDELEFKDNCFACDYDMDVSEKPLSFNVRFANQNHPQLPAYSASIVCLEASDNNFLRGPPHA